MGIVWKPTKYMIKVVRGSKGMGCDSRTVEDFKFLPLNSLEVCDVFISDTRVIAMRVEVVSDMISLGPRQASAVKLLEVGIQLNNSNARRMIMMVNKLKKQVGEYLNLTKPSQNLTEPY